MEKKKVSHTQGDQKGKEYLFQLQQRKLHQDIEHIQIS